MGGLRRPVLRVAECGATIMECRPERVKGQDALLEAYPGGVYANTRSPTARHCVVKSPFL